MIIKGSLSTYCFYIQMIHGRATSTTPTHPTHARFLRSKQCPCSGRRAQGAPELAPAGGAPGAAAADPRDIWSSCEDSAQAIEAWLSTREALYAETGGPYMFELGAARSSPRLLVILLDYRAVRLFVIPLD